MIPFFSPKLLHQQLEEEINAAVQRVLQSGWYILGPEVEAFEAEFSAYHGLKHTIGVANGTDAIELALRAADVGPGDEVITVSHTAMPTVTAIEATGAKPVLVDINPNTYTIDPETIETAISARSRVIVPVHLYGQPANMDPILKIAERHKLLVVEDCAQAHGAHYHNQLVGTFGHLATFSFYPTKNLGAYGDGGAVVTNDDFFAQRLRRLRFYGQETRYTCVERGANSRLDEIQAAILRVKLHHLDHHNQTRRVLAKIYDEKLIGVKRPVVLKGAQHVFHLYVIRHHARDILMENLKIRGIETLIHYPIPIHLQASHRDLGYTKGSLPVTEQIASEILSLPLYIGLTTDELGHISQAVEASVL